MFLEFLLAFIGTIVGVAIGGYILFAGRHAIHWTVGVIGIGATADLLAVLVADLDNGWALFAAEQWLLLGIALVMGVLGFLLGRAKPYVGVQVIGFVAGADITLWVYDVSAHVVTNIARLSEDAAFGVGLLLIVIGGLLGLWLVTVKEDEAIILITMILGAQMLQNALHLSRTSSWTAVIILTLSLAGILVQYALYLREIKADQLEVEPQPSSVAYFQDLELH